MFTSTCTFLVFLWKRPTLNLILRLGLGFNRFVIFVLQSLLYYSWIPPRSVKLTKMVLSLWIPISSFPLLTHVNLSSASAPSNSSISSRTLSFATLTSSMLSGRLQILISLSVSCLFVGLGGTPPPTASVPSSQPTVVITDKATGKSRGYGFVTFKHFDGALIALKEPSKRIDGRVTVTQLAAAGNSGSNTNAVDIALRKIYVANVPSELPADKLLAHFSLYGEIEEGPLGFDKQTGKSKGFALFVYKTSEGAQAALVDPVKTIEGKQLTCKLAIDGKQGKRGGGPMGDGVQAPGNSHGDAMGMAPPSSMPGSYAGSVGLGSYGGLQGQPPLGSHPLNSSLGGPGLSSVNAPPSLGGTGAYGGLGGPYGGYVGTASSGFGGLGGSGATGLGGGSGALGGAGLYILPTSAGMPAGGYPESGHYGLSSSGYPNQHHHPTGASSVPRVPPGGMYPNVPPYY